MLLSSNSALIGGNSTKPCSSYCALNKAVLLLLSKPGSSYYALIKAVLSLPLSTVAPAATTQRPLAASVFISLSSKLATNRVGFAGRGYLAMIETLGAWHLVYLRPLHCPVNTPAPRPDCSCLAAAHAA